MLFLSYISSISQLPLSNGAQMTLYADYLLLIKPIKVANDYILLQQDITTKCKYILGSRKRQPLLPPQEISISSCQIERAQSYCYLGVIVNQRISWSEHIQHLCLKVRKLIGILYRQFYTWADTLTLRAVYLTCIRPHMEYAAQLWDPCNKKDIEALKSVQKFACKVCLKLWDTSYDEHLTFQA